MKMKMKTVKAMLAAAVAAAGLAAFAKPSVEISNVSLADARDGKVSYTYTVSGDFEGKEYDLHVKVSAANGTKSAVVTHGSVTEGTVNTNVDVKALLGKAYPHVTFFAELKKPQMGGVQLWEGGPIWAECNVGAENPEDPGYYFWWGDTVGYVYDTVNKRWVSSQDGTTTIQFNQNDPVANKTYKQDPTQLKQNSWIGEDGNLLLANDAARVKLGGDWRMPTFSEINDLSTRCYAVKTTQNGVNGYLIKGKEETYSSRSIFFPVTGHGVGSTIGQAADQGRFWSSTPNESSNVYAKYLCADYKNSAFAVYTNIDRPCGLTIRAVRDAE